MTNSKQSVEFCPRQEQSAENIRAERALFDDDIPAYLRFRSGLPDQPNPITNQPKETNMSKATNMNPASESVHPVSHGYSTPAAAAAPVAAQNMVAQHSQAPFVPDEKNIRFLTAAESHVGTILRQLSLIERLASPRYEAKPEQIEEMFSCLQEAVQRARQKFTAPNVPVFKFGSGVARATKE